MANEKRLIDANLLVKDLEFLAKHEDSFRQSVILGVVQTVNTRPTVNAVPVVRCRECKYWGDEDGKLQDSDGVLFARCEVHNYLIEGRHTGWCPTENDFCSYGERKDGGE